MDLLLQKAIGCDETAVNTGHIGEVIRLLELYVLRPLQWFAACKRTVITTFN